MQFYNVSAESPKEMRPKPVGVYLRFPPTPNDFEQADTFQTSLAEKEKSQTY